MRLADIYRFIEIGSPADKFPIYVDFLSPFPFIISEDSFFHPSAERLNINCACALAISARSIGNRSFDWFYLDLVDNVNCCRFFCDDFRWVKFENWM